MKLQLQVLQHTEQRSQGVGVGLGEDGDSHGLGFNQAEEEELVEDANTAMETINAATEKNNLLKKEIEARLEENVRKAALVRAELKKKITSEERQELLELEYRIGMLELENMELEHSRMLHTSVVTEKDVLIERLRLQIAARDRVITEQQQQLEEKPLELE